MYNGNNLKNSCTALSSWCTHQSHQKSRRQVGEWQGCRQHTGWNHCDYRKKKKNNEKSETERYTLPQDSYLILKSNQDKMYFYRKSVDRLYKTSDNFNRAVITNSLIQLEYRIKSENTKKAKKSQFGWNLKLQKRRWAWSCMIQWMRTIWCNSAVFLFSFFFSP